MKAETFVKYFKEIYPNTYESLVVDFTRAMNKKKGRRGKK
jgi:hypothetical protein